MRKDSKSAEIAEQSNNSGCAACTTRNCYRKDSSFPSFCPTMEIAEDDINTTLNIYRSEDIDARLARAAAEVEGEFYGRLTRVEEIIAFARRLKAKRIGVATCVGLLEESRVFVKVLTSYGLIVKAVCCKIGGVDKLDIGLPDELKVKPGCTESICNPILQANYLNKWFSDLNIMVGLCVGHDSLFMRHSKAPVTTLAVKDRMLGHNPLAALYTSKFYYRRLLNPEEGLLSEDKD